MAFSNEDHARLRRYLARVERGAEMWLRWSEDNEYVPELPIDPEELSDVMDGFRLHRETLRDPRVRKVWEQVVGAAYRVQRHPPAPSGRCTLRGMTRGRRSGVGRSWSRIWQMVM